MAEFLGRVAGREWSESTLAQQLTDAHGLMDELEAEAKGLLAGEDSTK